MQTVITTSERGHGYRTGDVIEIRTPDMRWWKRLWHFVTFQASPVKVERARITAVSETTLGDSQQPHFSGYNPDRT